jgi:hypothetical protein
MADNKMDEFEDKVNEALEQKIYEEGGFHHVPMTVAEVMMASHMAIDHRLFTHVPFVSHTICSNV